MNILFLTITKFDSINHRGIYFDLIRKFYKEGHTVFVVSPRERRERGKTSIFREEVTILNIKTLNLQKTNFIEKGIGTLLIEHQFLSGIKKYFSNVVFDLVLYSTPPITFYKIISFIKKRDKAYSYLLLKDIFPQNAVDLNMIKKGSLLHKFFKLKEKKLYEVSDTIGCMSEGNREYLITHNAYLEPSKVEVNPNSIEPVCTSTAEGAKEVIRRKYNIPLGVTVFLYGGNLGVPQGIDFLLETINYAKDIKKVFFVIAGSGTQFKKVDEWIKLNSISKVILLANLPKKDYDQLVTACDVGMIFLDHRFTIPNFPSRLLSYLENKLPVLAATDSNTDIGKVVEENKCGHWVLSGDIKGMLEAIKKFDAQSPIFKSMKENAWKLLMNEYTVDRSYNLIQSKYL